MLFNGTGPSSKLLLTVENGGFENAHFLQDFADWKNYPSSIYGGVVKNHQVDPDKIFEKITNRSNSHNSKELSIGFSKQ